MRRALLDYLRCPACRAVLAVAGPEGEDEVREGLLRCVTRGHVYPIVRGIPRMVAGDGAAVGRDRPAPEGTGLSPGGQVPSGFQAATMQSFGRQWTTYRIQRPAEDRAYFLAKTGFDVGALRGTLVLDVGCGSGRYARVAGEAGGIVIALDLSLAVETAATVSGHLPNVHVVQGDLLRPPLAPARFDRIYSIGVLHHTPDTREAVARLVPLLAEGGELAIWLYPRWPWPVELYNRLLRAITTRLSLDRLHRLAVRAQPLGLLKLRLLTARAPWRRALGQLLRGLTIGVSYHPDREIRICDTFDWFSPPYQWHHTAAEVRAWLTEHGLVEIRDLSVGQVHYQFQYGHGVNFHARRPARSRGPAPVAPEAM